MKILLIDDGGQKYMTLVELMTKLFPGEVEIVHARSRQEAIALVRHTLFPLMLVDMYLPRVEKDLPEEDGGMKLIQFIEGNQALLKPWETIAISRQVLRNDLHSMLQEKNVPFIFCPEGEAAEFSAVLGRIGDLLGKERCGALVPTSHRVQYLVVTALRAEYDAALSFLKDPERCDVPFGCDRGRKGEVSTTDGGVATLAVIQIKDPGPVAAATAVANACGLFSPSAVILTGICGGVKGESKLGDLVLAREIVDYTRGKVVDNDGESYFEPESPSLSTNLDDANVVLVGEEAEKMLLEADFHIRHPRPAQRPSLIDGQIASGNQVVGRAETIKDLKTQRFRKLKAIEMEGWGAAWACNCIRRLRPKFYIFKSVSDLSDEDKGDLYHPYCSVLSAGFALKLIESGWI